MNGLALGLFIAVGVTIGVGIIVIVFFTVFRQRLKTTGMERMQARFRPEQILRSETTANFVGLESRGLPQVRGNGVLVLTRDELWFSRWALRDDFSMPLHQIEQILLVDAHLGKRYFGRKLLYVQFQTPQGKDAAAWAVGDPESWQRAITTARRGD